MEQLKCKKMCDEWEYTEVYSFYEFREMNQLIRIMQNEKNSITEIFTRMCSM